MDAYVSKPLRPYELLAAVDSLVASRPGSDGSKSSVVSGLPPTPTAKASSAREVGSQTPIAPHLDAATLLAGFNGNRTLLGEVIDIFLVDGPQLMTAIRQARESRDEKAFASSAHALKGSMGLFVQRGAYETARRLEQAGKSGDLTGVDDTLATLETEMTELRTALSDLRAGLR